MRISRETPQNADEAYMEASTLVGKAMELLNDAIEMMNLGNAYRNGLTPPRPPGNVVRFRRAA